MTADRFELLLNQQLVLQELHGFIAGKIRRIHGRRVADLLHELLRRRAEETASAIEGLRLQYPGYAEEIERRFIRRTSLRLEEREYEPCSPTGLSAASCIHVACRLDAARARLDARPRLDFALQREEFLRAFPVFEGMPADARKRLARALTTHYVEPGRTLIRKGEVPRSVYFIASGAVEMERRGQKLRLGRGEFFGHLGMLTGQPAPRHGQRDHALHACLRWTKPAFPPLAGPQQGAATGGRSQRRRARGECGTGHGANPARCLTVNPACHAGRCMAHQGKATRNRVDE